MSSAAEWDERFARGDHASPEIDPFLALSSKYWPLIPGWQQAQAPSAKPAARLKALDVACGAGRNAVHLARAGFGVSAVDFSSQGLIAAGELARSRQVSIETRQADLEAESVELGDAAFDLVAVFFFLHRPLVAHLRHCLRAGGLLVYKTYSVDQLRHPGGPSHPMHLLEHNELLREFSVRELPGFRVLRYEEEWEGKGTAALVAQKP
jgi:SAM-dependent methyltransferase